MPDTPNALTIALSLSRREFFSRHCEDSAKPLAEIQSRHDDLLAKENAKISAAAILS